MAHTLQEKQADAGLMRLRRANDKMADKVMRTAPGHESILLSATDANLLSPERVDGRIRYIIRPRCRIDRRNQLLKRAGHVRRTVAHIRLGRAVCHQVGKRRAGDERHADRDPYIVGQYMPCCMTAQAFSRHCPLNDLAFIVREEISRQKVDEKGDVLCCAHCIQMQCLSISCKPAGTRDCLRTDHRIQVHRM